MTRLIAFFARASLFARKADETDAFDLRLTRLGLREARARAQGAIFRNRPSHSAGAAIS
jgi:hypothetical protein